MDRAARLRKRGSLQARDRQTISKATGERLFSVPNFLELIQTNNNTINNKRGSVIIYGNRNNKKLIRAGNLDGLVELLTADEGDTQPAYVETFVATHSYFVDSQSLMTRLMERFYDSEDGRVIDVFKKWMTFYFEDFTEENAIFFNMFLSDLSSKGFEAHADDLRSVFRVQGEAYRKRLAQEEVDAEKERAALAASEDITHRVPDLEDDDHDPADIARQMTLIEERLYKEISLREFLQLAWSKKDGKEKAKKLTRLINRFNAVSFWAASAILTCDHSSKKRSKMLSLFIQVADACLNLQNFQSAMQLYSTLNLTPIERLEKEWNSLPKKVSQMYERLKEFFESGGNFKRYRETLAKVEAPAIPVLSFILSDLTMIEENKSSIKIKVSEGSGIQGGSVIPGSGGSGIQAGDGSGIQDGGDGGSGIQAGDGSGIQAGGGSGIEEEEESELVHFEKMSMIYNTLSQLKKCGNVAYPRDDHDNGGDHNENGEKRERDKKANKASTAREELVKMLTDLPRLSEKELYDLKNDTKKKVKDLKKALKASRKK